MDRMPLFKIQRPGGRTSEGELSGSLPSAFARSGKRWHLSVSASIMNYMQMDYPVTNTTQLVVVLEVDQPSKEELGGC